MDCTIYVAKTKALISFAVTAKLICVFVFAYAKSRFSHDAAHFESLTDNGIQFVKLLQMSTLFLLSTRPVAVNYLMAFRSGYFCMCMLLYVFFYVIVVNYFMSHL